MPISLPFIDKCLIYNVLKLKNRLVECEKTFILICYFIKMVGLHRKRKIDLNSQKGIK